MSYAFILIIEKLAFDTHKWLEVHVHPDLHDHEHKKSLKQNKQENSTFLGLKYFHLIFMTVFSVSERKLHMLR